jgi:hypothetical protein
VLGVLGGGYATGHAIGYSTKVLEAFCFYWVLYLQGRFAYRIKAGSIALSERSGIYFPIFYFKFSRGEEVVKSGGGDGCTTSNCTCSYILKSSRSSGFPSPSPLGKLLLDTHGIHRSREHQDGTEYI